MGSRIDHIYQQGLESLDLFYDGPEAQCAFPGCLSTEGVGEGGYCALHKGRMCRKREYKKLSARG